MRFRFAILLCLAALALSCTEEEEEVVIVKKKVGPDPVKEHKQMTELAKKLDAEQRKKEEVAPTVTLAQSATVGKIRVRPLKIELRPVKLAKGSGMRAFGGDLPTLLVLSCEFENTSEAQKIKPLALTLSRCEVVFTVENRAERLSEIKIHEALCIEPGRVDEKKLLEPKQKMTTLLICEAPNPTAEVPKKYTWMIHFTKDMDGDVGLVRLDFEKSDITVVPAKPAEEPAETKEP